MTINSRMWTKHFDKKLLGVDLNDIRNNVGGKLDLLKVCYTLSVNFSELERIYSLSVV